MNHSLPSSPPPSESGDFLVSGAELVQWYAEAKAQAIAAQVPLHELDWLLQAWSDLDRLTLRLGTVETRSQIALKLPLSEITAHWQQRLHQRIPVQYLVGRVAWRNFSLQVSPAVLIPRPETEALIDLAVAATNQADLSLEAGIWADLGTGSGAIAIGLATAFPQATIHAVDTSAEALAIAQANAQAYHLHERIHFHQGSWFQPLTWLQGQLSGMVSNPPYIPRAVVPTLQPEVAGHEPHLALDGGEDGLDCIRQLVSAAPLYLRSGGVWLVEMMAGQAAAVEQLLQQAGHYHSIQIHRDLAGIERFAIATRC